MAAAPLRRLRLVNLPPETLALLRFGRGVDNRKLKGAGFTYRFTTAGAVQTSPRRNGCGGWSARPEPTYRYESDVESFFRHSPAVVRV